MATSNKTTRKLQKKLITTMQKQNYSGIKPATNLRFTPKQIKIGAVIVLIVIIAVLAFNKFKNKIIAATVNGQPIFTWELNSRLSTQFGAQMLDTIVSEKLITNEAAKQKVSVVQQEIDAKIADVEKSLGANTKLEDALQAQGLTKDQFVQQIKLRLLIDKMISKDISVSATEIEDYVKNNKATLTASSPAEQLVEAETAVRNSKMEQKFYEWFSKLKESAKIIKF